MKIGLVGAAGFIGSRLFNALNLDSKNSLIPITRKNYSLEKNNSFDLLINCAMPGKKYWANLNPLDDFKETVEKTAEIYYGFKFSKFVQISSLSARAQLDTIYGRNKKAAEDLLDNNNSLILRLGSFYSLEMEKGPVHDILNNKSMFVSEKSSYSWISLDKLIGFICQSLDKFGTIEIGGNGVVSLKEIADFLNLSPKFGVRDEHIALDFQSEHLPKSTEIFSFLKQFSKK